MQKRTTTRSPTSQALNHSWPEAFFTSRTIQRRSIFVSPSISQGRVTRFHVRASDDPASETDTYEEIHMLTKMTLLRRVVVVLMGLCSLQVASMNIASAEELYSGSTCHASGANGYDFDDITYWLGGIGWT